MEAVVQVAAHVMRDFRDEVRRLPTNGLTLTQLKSLAYLKSSAGASLSDVADYVGLGAPTLSKVIDDLVQQEMVRRETSAEDRRRVTLHLTRRGGTALQSVRGPALEALAQRLATLSEDERAAVVRAMSLLDPLFDRGGTGCEREEDA
ncbi:MAG TPA: MarR family transcriptional regulator [Longimicrobium sp.]|nr:MarR family transcriptional regulator [Longimicrobium sp.]